METFTDVLLVTANVGSLFDNVSRLAESEITSTPDRSAARGLYSMLLD